MVPRPSALLLLTVGSPLLAGCELEICPADLARDEPETLATADDAIIGGVVDDEHHATVALLFQTQSGGTGLCSGTIIAKQGDVGHVLTAAHCVQGVVQHVYEATDWRSCTSGTDPGCRASYLPTAWQAHPGYDPSTYAYDFAVVTFSGATEATPVVPAVAGYDGLEIADRVVLSGFGRTYAGPATGEPTQSLRHMVEVPVASAGAAYLRFDASTGKTACFGDSGGPAYALVGGELRVAGVASTADADCAHVATYRRVSDVYDSFIAPIIAPGEAPCDACGGGGGGQGGMGAGSTSTSGGEGAAGGGSGAGDGDGGADGGVDVDPDPGCIPLELRCSVEALGAGAPRGGIGLLAFAAWLVRRSREKKRTARFSG